MRKLTSARIIFLLANNFIPTPNTKIRFCVRTWESFIAVFLLHIKTNYVYPQVHLDPLKNPWQAGQNRRCVLVS